MKPAMREALCSKLAKNRANIFAKTLKNPLTQVSFPNIMAFVLFAGSRKQSKTQTKPSKADDRLHKKQLASYAKCGNMSNNKMRAKKFAPAP